MLFASVLLLSALACAHIGKPLFVVGAWPAEQTNASSCWIDKGKQCGGHGKCIDHVCACDPCWQGYGCHIYVDIHQPRFLVNNFYIIINKNFAGAVFRAEATDDDLGLTCPLHGPGEGTTCPCATTRFNMLHGADSTLFSVDNETGDVFLAEGATLLPGRQYHFTLEAQGLKMGTFDNKIGRDLMRAIVYVRPDEAKHRLALDFPSGPLMRKKREAKERAENLERSISLELVRVSPEDEPLQIGSSVVYKAVVNLPAERAWSRPLGVQISTDQLDARLALCQARVSGVKGALVSSLGPINTLQPQLVAHKTFSTMWVQAVFDFGVISLLEHNSNDSRPSVEMTFEAVVARPGGKDAPLDYIRATLTDDEAEAVVPLDLSNLLQNKAPEDAALLAVETVLADSQVAADRPADFTWRLTPPLASGDLTVTINQVSGGQALIRVGGLSVDSEDAGFHCLAAARAKLASQACLLIDDSNATTLAKLHLPLYVLRRTGSALTIKAWLLPLRTPWRRPFVSVEAVFSTSGAAPCSSQHNVTLAPAAPATQPTPKIVVKAASASEVPAGIPVVFHAKLHLPRGLFNLTAALRTLTKGGTITDLSLLRVGEDVDQDLVHQHEIVRKSDRQLEFQVLDAVLVRQDAKDGVVLRISVAGVEKGFAKFGFKLVAYPELEEVQFQILVTPYQPPVVTPEVSITPYEDQTLFEQQGILEFRLQLKVPEGSCTKPVTLELGSSFKGSEEVTTSLCKVTFSEQNDVIPKMLEPQHVLNLGALCAPRTSRTGGRSHHTFTLAATFQASTLRAKEIEGTIRIDARMQIGMAPFWSGGVSTHLVDKLSNVRGCASLASEDKCRL